MVAAARTEGLSRSVEDYLKVIYTLGAGGIAVQTSAIAEALAVAPASVSGMVRRLAEGGLIEHVPYRGVELTRTGRRTALRMIRRHRIIETYLVTRLGYAWEDVHEEAERMEHAVSDDLIDRMARALGDPRFDPHGAPIPTADGVIEEPLLVSLGEVPLGARAEFRMVSDKDPERLRFIASLGFQLGTRFAVLDAQPFNGPVIVKRDDAEASQVIGRELARSLRCVVVED